MSDDEVIRFEITDYDLDNEFNPNRNRRAKKEQQIYGLLLFPLFVVIYLEYNYIVMYYIRNGIQ